MFGIGFEEAGVTEAKFKVGDLVRVVKSGNRPGGSRHGAVVGFVDEIINVDPTDDLHPYEGKCWYYNEHEIELAPVGPKFKMGDRVRVIDGDYGDKVFQITDVDDDMGLTYYWVLPHGYCFQEARLELAPDCAERKVEQDNAPAKPQPKFKAGDVVGYYPGSIMGDQKFTIKCVKTHFPDGRPYEHETAYDFTQGTEWDLESSLVLAQPSTPAIVALVKNGKPLPSRYPHVHDSVEDATAEAERLARNNPGQEFAVYQRVVGRVCEATYSMKEVA